MKKNKKLKNQKKKMNSYLNKKKLVFDIISFKCINYFNKKFE